MTIARVSCVSSPDAKVDKKPFKDSSLLTKPQIMQLLLIIIYYLVNVEVIGTLLSIIIFCLYILYVFKVNLWEMWASKIKLHNIV